MIPGRIRWAAASAALILVLCPGCSDELAGPGCPDHGVADSSTLDTGVPDGGANDLGMKDVGATDLGGGPHRRQPIPLYAGIGAGKGFQVEVKVGQSTQAPGSHLNLGGHGRKDFADVRFTAADGKTALPHWLESMAGQAPHQTATFRIRVAADLNSSQHIYIYYGEPAAKSVSNAAAVFELYDGMETPFSLNKTALANAAAPQKTPTYDKSGQAIHPDIVHFPKGWNGYTHWMAMTPYPGSNDQLENPSLLASNDGVNWVAPAGLKAPLAPAPPCDHNNDTDLVYNQSTDELWIYYLDTRRASRCAAHKVQPYYNHNYVQLIRVGRSGSKWVVSAPAISLDQDLSKEALLLSPSVVRRSSTSWYLWMTNGSDKVLRFESADGKTWAKGTKLSIADKVWHLNVDYVASKNQYWMLSDYPVSKGSLRWATSTDGLTWTTYPGLVMAPNPAGWDTNLYRGCFLYDAAKDLLRTWYCAYQTGPTVWGTGYAEKKYADFLKEVQVHPAGGWSVFQQGGSWSSSKDRARRGSASGKLVQTGTSSNNKMIVHRPAPLSTGFTLEWDLYDDLDQTAFKMVRVDSAVISGQTGVGVWSGASKTHYVFHDTTYSYIATTAARSKGWHKLGIHVGPFDVSYYVDGLRLGSMAGQVSSVKAISVEGYPGGTTTFYVDDLRVRRAAIKAPQVGPPGAEERGTWGKIFQP